MSAGQSLYRTACGMRLLGEINFEEKAPWLLKLPSYNSLVLHIHVGISRALWLARGYITSKDGLIIV